LLLSGKLLAVSDPVQLNCTVVNADGSVTLSWENPADLSNFFAYDIYHSSGSTYSKIASVTTVTNSFTHNITQGNTAQQFYFVKIVDNSSIFYDSDTLGTIYLQLDNNDPDFNKADLYFTKVSVPSPTGTLGNYNIYWDYPDGSWNLIDNTNESPFAKDVIVCYDTINFKVELENQSGCKSVSNTVGNWFKDVDYPEATVFDSVSINNNSETVFGWQPSPSGDVVGYILYDYIGSGFSFDTVWGINNTFYVDSRFDACNESHQYAIAAIDSCGNKSEGSFLKPLQPVLLYNIGYNICAQQDTLVWEQYINATPDIEHYLIWRSENGIDFEIIDTVAAQPAPNPPSGIQADQMWFIDEGIDPGISYIYYVQAVFGAFTSSSCKKTVDSYTYRVPQHIYFANADVLPSDEIELTLDVDTSVYSCIWELYRFDPLNNTEEAFSITERSNLDGFPLSAIDSDVEPKNTSYNYYALVYDSCGIKRLDQSNTLTTIHLSGSKPDEPTNRLEWNAFEGWETTVEKYFIYRQSGMESSFTLLDSVDGQTFEYDDLIDPEQASDGKFSYFVEAKQSAGGIYNYRALSRSNIFDLFFDSEIFFPNAFRPGGTNSSFKPLFTYFSGSDYLLQIYNRWGQLVFETTDSEEGWNGTVEGKTQSSGLFVYRLTYKNIHNLSIEKKGTVVLVN